ncbi:hypothetical protein GGF46_001452 [Coemansia sp. RSA 552]|nr:hypothetical protein GGF46_001452 [Coemansia sp. RSA 552]
MTDAEQCAQRRDELLTTKLWVRDLRSHYLEFLKGNARDLPTDLEQFPAAIHDYIDYYSREYARNQEALVAYRARELFAERIKGAAFIPSDGELNKLETSVAEEERLLKQVQLRLSEKVREANGRIEAQSQRYEQVLGLAQVNEELETDVAELESELEELTQALDQKERQERDAAEQQVRELQAAHNDLIRETAMCEEMDRERVRQEDRAQRLKSDEQKRRLNAADSQEQQQLVERWVKAVAPVVGARVEGSTLVLTLGDGLGPMSNRRILAQFNELGRIESVRADNGRALPAQLNHKALMDLFL